MNSREIIKRLQDDGWLHHHTKGDHNQFKHPEKPGKVTVPHPKKDIAVGTLRVSVNLNPRRSVFIDSVRADLVRQQLQII